MTPKTSDGKESPEVMRIRLLYTQARLATQDARDALLPEVPVREMQYMVARAQIALLEAQIEHGRWMAP